MFLKTETGDSFKWKSTLEDLDLDQLFSIFKDIYTSFVSDRDAPEPWDWSLLPRGMTWHSLHVPVLTPVVVVLDFQTEDSGLRTVVFSCYGS